MDHDLAKKLKDAGFPLRKCEYAHHDETHLGKCAYCSQPAFIVDDTHYIIPTLSELIEACGPYVFRNFVLGWGCNGIGWYAFLVLGDRGDRTSAKGSTPDEAVANLWIALKAPTEKTHN